MATGIDAASLLKTLFYSIANNPSSENISKNILQTLPYGDYVFKRYDVISEYIFELDEKSFFVVKKYFDENIDFNSPSYQKMKMNLDIYQNVEYIEILDKFERHVKLACFQRKFILDNVSKANEIAEGLVETKNKIYSEFIAILGIFTAISFALMGSIQTFGTVFSKVEDPSTASIGYAIIAGAIYLIIMIVLITVLFVGMKRVINANNDKIPGWIIWTTISAIVVLVIVGTVLIIIKKRPL